MNFEYEEITFELFFYLYTNTHPDYIIVYHTILRPTICTMHDCHKIQN